MKNIHVLPTDKPSRLSILNSGKLNFGAEIMSSSNSKPQHIYITNDEEIKDGDWILYCNSVYKVLRINSNNRPVVKMSDGEFELSNWNKIILTDNKDLIKDGVQAIDDEFLEWFVKNPSCEEVETKLVEFEVDMELGDSCIEYGSYYEIIIPKEEPKQETPESIIQDIATHLSKTVPETLQHIEEFSKELDKLKSKQETLEKAAHKMLMDYGIMSVSESINVLNVKKLMVLFAKEQSERRYSEEEAFGIIYVLETLLDFAGEAKEDSISISTTDAEKIIKLLKQIK